jgi:peptide/nickel transport system substrate-binding protein
MGRGVLLFLTLSLAGCGTAETPRQMATSESTVLTVGLPEGNATGEDLGVGQFINLLSFESLTLTGPDGRATPRLAERWQWEDIGRTLRVQLRRSVFLHDNRPFTGETAVELITKALTLPQNVARYPPLADIESISAAGDLQILIRLTRPSALLPEDLSVPLDRGGEGTGTGPFRVASKSPDVVLERFERYYLGPPTIERIIVKSFDALRPTWASLLRGELDMVYDVPADAVQFIRNDDVEVISVPRWYQHLLAFNSHSGPLRSPMVRKALNLAVDRAGIVERVLLGAGEAATGPLYPRYWAYDGSLPKYQHDPATAATLLDAAGYPLPKTSDLSAPRARFRFTCLLPENFAVWQGIALEIQRNLFDVGVDMQFKVVPFKQFNTLVGSGEFEAVFLDLISGPTPARPYIWWRSTRHFKGLYNVFGYENANAERLFETLLRSTNEAAIRSATSNLQRVLYDDPPAIFVAWDTRARAISRRFVWPNDGRDPMWSLWKWTVAPSSTAALAP